MQLSEKSNTFCSFLISYLEYTLKLEHFEKKKKNDGRSLNVSEIIDSERRGYLNA